MHSTTKRCAHQPFGTEALYMATVARPLFLFFFLIWPFIEYISVLSTITDMERSQSMVFLILWFWNWFVEKRIAMMTPKFKLNRPDCRSISLLGDCYLHVDNPAELRDDLFFLSASVCLCVCLNIYILVFYVIKLYVSIYFPILLWIVLGKCFAMRITISLFW